MDRNQAIGLGIITGIFLLYMFFFAPQETLPPAAKTKVEKKETINNTATASDTSASDSLLQKKFGGFAALAKGVAKEDTLANADVKITLNTHGGVVEKVLLKKYLTDDKKPLYLIEPKTSKMDLIVPTQTGDINLSDLYYTSTTTDSSIIYKAEVGPNQYIEHRYVLPKQGYELKYDLKLVGLDNVVKNENVTFNWEAHLPKLEKDLELSRTTSTLNYYYDSKDNESFESMNERSKDPETVKLEYPVKWISMKQKFFSSAIIAENSNFASGTLKSEVVLADSATVKDLNANLFIPASDLKVGKGNFRYYFGPNQYNILKDVTDGFGKNVHLGWPGINFINRFIVIPVFHFMEKFISNYGIIIIILVILLKLILFPLSYKSYMAMAKMKVLKPEIDDIKAKYGDDMQKSQMETMELYRKVGINPLSGCIPVLLQMPILLAMFNFFPNSIELRQQAFLWAPDLSTYDAPLMLPFTIPFYGNHVSLFTLLMTISTIVYTWFNNQVSTVQGPMKTVSYIMPVVFMFVLNSFPAGLSFYYFVSNIFTILQQIIIRKFVDENKIRQTLEDNKKRIASNPNKKSRWMQRMEDAMKAKEDASKKKKGK